MASGAGVGVVASTGGEIFASSLRLALARPDARRPTNNRISALLKRAPELQWSGKGSG